jgi:nucleoside-diphosphate-sugar epimerase
MMDNSFHTISHKSRGSRPRFLLTGATGFIGRRISVVLSDYADVLPLERQQLFALVSSTSCFGNSIDSDMLFQVRKFAPTHIVHCAAIAHRPSPRTNSDIEALHEINVSLSVKLAQLAVYLQIDHFVFLSTIGVHGSQTAIGESFSESSPISPSNAYAYSKYLAEQGLYEVLDSTSCRLSIIRPALVYGRGAPGNIRYLVQAIDTGLPFPFKGIENSRSFIAVDNLVSAVLAVALRDSDTNEVYVVADSNQLSTEALIRAIADIRGKTCRMLFVPEPLIRFSLRLPFVGSRLTQLTSSLVVDSSKIRTDLSWQQPYKQKVALFKAFGPSSSSFSLNVT